MKVNMHAPAPPEYPFLGNCWEWTAARDEHGYGKFSIGGVPVRAHRFALFGVSAQAAKLCACHLCDNPSCVRPSHLFAGTNQENVADKIRKGRQARLKGEDSHRALLTEEQVREIRSLNGVVSGRELARRFGVTPAAICNIQKRRVWTHI